MKGPSPIGANLRRLRESRELSQVQLADMAGITEQTVANIETQRVRAPQERVLVALAKALKVNVEEFYRPPPPDPAHMPPALKEFVEDRAKKGRPLTDAQIQELLEHKFRGRPTVQTYAYLLNAIEETEET